VWPQNSLGVFLGSSHWFICAHGLFVFLNLLRYRISKLLDDVCWMVSLFLNIGRLLTKSLHYIDFVPCFDCFCFNRGFGLSVTFLPSFTPDNQELPVLFKTLQQSSTHLQATIKFGVIKCLEHCPEKFLDSVQEWYSIFILVCKYVCVCVWRVMLWEYVFVLYHNSRNFCLAPTSPFNVLAIINN
jgi:hypothetical protein